MKTEAGKPHTESNSLVNGALPLITTVYSAFHESNGHTSQENIEALLIDYERSMMAEGVPPILLTDAKFAWTAWIDEVAMSVDWPGRDHWRQRPLQQRYFGEGNAGETFFEKIDVFIGNPEVYREVLVVYQLVLSLGFRGKYALLGESARETVMEHIAQILKTETSEIPTLNFHRQVRSVNDGRRKPMSNTAIIFALLGISLVIYLGFSVGVQQDFRKVRAAHRQDIQNMLSHGV